MRRFLLLQSPSCTPRARPLRLSAYKYTQERMYAIRFNRTVRNERISPVPTRPSHRGFCCAGCSALKNPRSCYHLLPLEPGQSLNPVRRRAGPPNLPRLPRHSAAGKVPGSIILPFFGGCTNTHTYTYGINPPAPPRVPATVITG